MKTSFMFKEDYERLQAQLRKTKTTNPLVKPIGSLKTLDCLGLDKTTKHYIKDREYTPIQAVREARDYVYQRSTGVNSPMIWLDDLSKRLLRAGYIRRDLTSKTFAIGKLYKAVYGLIDKDTTGIYASYDELDTDEAYESCQHISVDLYHKIIEHIDKSLDVRSANIIKLRFGLDGHRPRTYADIGKIYDISGQVARRLVCNALQTLSETKLPSLT